MGFANGWEWIIILAIVLLLFGGRRLPELSRSLGESIRGFRNELDPEDKDSTTRDDRPETSTSER